MDGTDVGAEEHFEVWMAQTLVRRIVGRCVERVEKRRREEEHFEEGVTCMFEVTPGRWGQKWRVTERRRRTLRPPQPRGLSSRSLLEGCRAKSGPPPPPPHDKRRRHA